MVVNFKDTSTSGFLNSHQMKALQRNMAEFGDYLKGKYDYISKFDMLRDEKDAR